MHATSQTDRGGSGGHDCNGTLEQRLHDR
jgi:hypothetical protein